MSGFDWTWPGRPIPIGERNPVYLPGGQDLSLRTVATATKRTRLLYFTGDPTTGSLSG